MLRAASQMDYFNRISKEDYVAALFTATERKKMVKQVKQPVGRSRKPLLELSATQADKENVQVAPDPRNSE